jgi:modification methylase
MTTTTTPRSSQPSNVPLAIWPVTQTTAQYQRAGRYDPECSAHPGKMLPELARRIVTEYSSSGDLVVDPMAGIGTSVVEAALLDRRAVGVELEQRWATLAESNFDLMLARPKRRLAKIHLGDARYLPKVLGKLSGRVDLIVTSPPYGCDAGTIDREAWRTGGSLCSPDSFNYSADRANLGHARGTAYEVAMTEIYAACFAALRPGGILAVVTKNTRRGGRTLDLAGLTVALAGVAGFSYLQHVIALHAAIRDSDLIPRPSYWQITQVRHARQRGEPVHLVAHEDLTVFLKPPATTTSGDAHAN